MTERANEVTSNPCVEPPPLSRGGRAEGEGEGRQSSKPTQGKLSTRVLALCVCLLAGTNTRAPIHWIRRALRVVSCVLLLSWVYRRLGESGRRLM